jgi:hypothetical protein
MFIKRTTGKSLTPIRAKNIVPVVYPYPGGSFIIEINSRMIPFSGYLTTIICFSLVNQKKIGLYTGIFFIPAHL